MIKPLEVFFRQYKQKVIVFIYICIDSSYTNGRGKLLYKSCCTYLHFCNSLILLKLVIHVFLMKSLRQWSVV